MFEGMVEGVPRATRQPYMSDPICTLPNLARANPCGGRGLYRTGPTPRRARGRRGLHRAGQLEPDAGLAVVARDPPAIGHLVDEHEPEPARLERVGALRALGRDPARAAPVADLHVGAVLVA